jgi:hypothetical protein
MKKQIDRAKVEQALKRAAKEGVSGSREARAGRFIPPPKTSSLSPKKDRQAAQKLKP